MRCNHVRPKLRRCPIINNYLDRSSLPPSATETHTHLAHSLVRYLDVTSPVELTEFGLISAGDLVDIISRVNFFVFL
jgi:SET and MYND domain-containing protein